MDQVAYQDGIADRVTLVRVPRCNIMPLRLSQLGYLPPRHFSLGAVGVAPKAAAPIRCHRAVEGQDHFALRQSQRNSTAQICNWATATVNVKHPRAAERSGIR